MSTQEALALLEQLDTYISGDESNNDDFQIDNVNLQKASSSKNSDSNHMEHCANVVSPVPKSGRSCGHGRKQIQGKTYRIFVMAVVTISAAVLFELR